MLIDEFEKTNEELIDLQEVYNQNITEINEKLDLILDYLDIKGNHNSQN